MHNSPSSRRQETAKLLQAPGSSRTDCYSTISRQAPLRHPHESSDQNQKKMSSETKSGAPVISARARGQDRTPVDEGRVTASFTWLIPTDSTIGVLSRGALCRKHLALRPHKPLRLIRDGEVGGSGISYLIPTRFTVTTGMILH